MRYGTIRENVLGLEVVLADGRIIKTGGRARKAANGYDLTHLFLGSEGTLGIISKIRLRLHGIPEAVISAVCQFSSLQNAVEAVITTLRVGIPVARIELLDDAQMAACIGYSKLAELAADATLFVEFNGSAPSVDQQSRAFAEIARDHSCSRYAASSDASRRAELWKARHNAYWAAVSQRPGAKGIATDICVPISRLAEAILATKEDIAKSGLQAPIVGHVGDGNFHCCILVDPNDPAELQRAFDLDHRIVARALALGGTCSGEHGIGLGKRQFLSMEHGEGALEVMRTLKAALDPRNILNPGKIFPKGQSSVLRNATANN